jgi:pimeloyl-ACP methyl ester carboxylesterase
MVSAMSNDLRYATAADGGRIAYRVAGDGPVDLLVVTGHGAVFSIEAAHELPRLRRFEESLAEFCRLITFDLRGFGLSDPLGADWPIEQRVADIIAVLDDCGSDRPALFGAGWGGGMAIEFAAAHPERVHSIIFVNGWVRTLLADDFPIGLSPQEWDQLGSDGFDPNDSSSDIDTLAPSVADDAATRRWWDRESRRGASPASALAAWRWSRDVDVRADIERLTQPLLVIEATEDVLIPEGGGQWIIDHARDARMLSIPVADHIAWAMPHTPVIGAVEEFLVGTAVQRSGQGVLRAILFTDIVDSTQHNVDAGDERWVEQLATHDLAVDHQIKRVGGITIKSMGDGVLATFTTPSTAVAAAQGIIDSAAEIGLAVRAAIHVAEVHERDGDVHGLGVTVTARALAHADGGQVVVTSTVRDLVEGSAHDFEPLGTFRLKGLDRDWELLTHQSPDRVQPTSLVPSAGWS